MEMELLANSFIGILFVVTGAMLKKNTPNRNRVLGYKSPMAMKNDETWEKGNKFFGTAMIYGGFMSILLSIILTLIYDANMSNKLSLGISVILGIISIASTEIYLIKTYNKNKAKK